MSLLDRAQRMPKAAIKEIIGTIANFLHFKPRKAKNIQERKRASTLLGYRAGYSVQAETETSILFCPDRNSRHVFRRFQISLGALCCGAQDR